MNSILELTGVQRDLTSRLAWLGSGNGPSQAAHVFRQLQAPFLTPLLICNRLSFPPFVD
ncbi:MAG: hypothetical protein AAGJ31_12445 [Verrucomicrobiota bacterium]